MCATCLPPAPEEPVFIRIGADAAGIFVKPSAYLAEGFYEYKSACDAAGTRYDFNNKCNRAEMSQVGPLAEALRAKGFKVTIEDSILEALNASRAAATAAREGAKGRAAAINAILAKKGGALYGFQTSGVDWLAPRKGALLADDMGCVDGEAEIQVNRAGSGFRCSLKDAHDRFHGKAQQKNHNWDPTIPTYIKALVDGKLRQHKVLSFLDKGVKDVLKITLQSGKTLRLTPDHEIAQPGDMWVEAQDLQPGDTVLTNGKAACAHCGETTDVISYKRAKFLGFCKKCMYRVKRAKPTYNGGKIVDKDGYVRVTAGHHDHPRRTTGGVYEHILVMEAEIGRHVTCDEVVHHKNGNKADNRIENLELLTVTEHAVLHGKEDKYLNMHGGTAGTGGRITFIPEEDTVVSVEPDGAAHVYDVIMEDPHRNFVANGIVVHNCGKTIQALAASPDDAPILVVGPSVAKGVWVREAGMWREDLTATKLAGRKSFRWPAKGEMVVTNYDILPPVDILEKNYDRLTKASDKAKWEAAKALLDSCPDNVVLISDEAHALKNPKALRTRRFTALAETVRAKGGRSWGLTATPLLNNPAELWTLLTVFGLEKESFGTKGRFNKAFNAYFNGYGYEWGTPEPWAADHLAKVMLRRRKNEVLKDLPEKTYDELKVNNLPASVRKLLDAAWDSVKAIMEDKKLSPEDILRRMAGESFEDLSRARAALAAAKIPAMQQLVESYEAAGEPLVVFSAHRMPIDALGERDGWATITGSTSPDERTRIESDFQAGKLKGVACTIKAGGVAITLTRSSNAIFVDKEWTPALNSQAEDRIYRIGQSRGVVITSLVAEHPLDERIAELLAVKASIINASVEAARVDENFQPAETETVSSDDFSDEDLEIAKKAKEAFEALLKAMEEELENERREREAAKEREANMSAGERVAERRARKQGVRLKGERRGPKTAREHWAAGALIALAENDTDRAFEKNGIGFNKADGSIGHYLAGMVAEGLTGGEWALATLTCSKYQGQVGPMPAK